MRRQLTSPVIRGGTIYVAGHEGEIYEPQRLVYSLDARTGDQRWKTDVKREITSLAVHDGLVYVGTKGAALALNANDGTQQWIYETDDTVSNPTVTEEAMYFGGRESIYALDPGTGDLRRKLSLNIDWHDKFAIAGDTLVIGSGAIYAVDRTTGRQQWTRETRRSLYSPVIANETVYFSDLGHVRAVTLRSGEDRWTTDTSNIASRSMASQLSAAGNVQNSIGFTQLKSRRSSGGPLTSQLAVTDERVYVLNNEHHLIALTADTGEIAWTTAIDSNRRGLGAPVVVGEHVYVSGNIVRAVSMEDGVVEAGVSLPVGEVASPPVVVDGIAFVSIRGSDAYFFAALTPN